jgi:hypothetical protein
LVLDSEAVAKYEAVIHLERPEIGFYINPALSRLIYEDAGAQGFHAAGGELARDVIERYSGRGHAAYEQYVTPARVEFARKHNFGLAAVAVARDVHEATADLHVERAYQVGQEYERVVEDAHDRQIPLRRVLADLVGKLAYARMYIFF